MNKKPEKKKKKDTRNQDGRNQTAKDFRCELADDG